MDVNDARVAVTVIGLVLFIAIVAYTWSRRRKHDHDEAANLPFLDEGRPANRERGERRE